MLRYAPVFVIASLLGACWEVGGANTQESVRGNTDTGNLIGFQLNIGRDGRHLVAAGRDNSGVYSVDLQTFASVELELAFDARRMAFADDEGAYFVSGDGTRGIVEKVSLTTGRRVGRWVVPVDMMYMTYDERSERLVFWSPIRTDLYLLDPRSGAMQGGDLGRALVDVRWLRSGELAVVLATEWTGDEPKSEVRLYTPRSSATGDLRSWPTRQFEVPNCASRLVVSPAGELAMMAPVACQIDPVSIIDLARAEFVENLPGFGPVAFSPDGETAVAFGRRTDLATFGIETGTAYSLLFISLRDRSIETLDIGDALPIYQLTPDGQVVLVYSVLESASYDGIYLIDVATRTIRETTGPELPLWEFVITPDSRLVYLIEGGLFRLDVATGEIAFVKLGCGDVGQPARCNPELVNMLPDGETLVLGWRNDPEYALFDIGQETVTRTFIVGQRSTGPQLAN